MKQLAAYQPIQGPRYGEPDWYAVRSSAIFASEAAKACGVSDYGQPLDIYLEKRGLVEPFEGNDYTDRGKRFEPFIAGEYEQRHGVKLTVNLPTCFHPEFRYMGATPDAQRSAEYGVEFKACNFRRAAQFGDEGSDDIPEDWVCQSQQQMFVQNWRVVDVFVMVDLHTYRTFTVERNESLIDRMIGLEGLLWAQIQRGEPPAPDFKHPKTLELVKQLYGNRQGEPVDLSESGVTRWGELVDVRAGIKSLEKRRDELSSELFMELGEAAAGRLPGGEREVSRTIIRDSIWTEGDIEHVRESLGKVKRKGYVKLTERKTR